MENVHQWSINYILLFLICTISILAYSLLNPPGETPNGVSQLSASQGPCILNMELLWRWLITQPYGSHHHWSPQTLSASTTTPKLIVNDFTSYLARKKRKKKYIYIYIHTRTHAQSLIHVWLFVTPWTVACQAPLSMGIPRSGSPFPSPGNLLKSEIKPASSALVEGTLLLSHQGGPHTYTHI